MGFGMTKSLIRMWKVEKKERWIREPPDVPFSLFTSPQISPCGASPRSSTSTEHIVSYWRLPVLGLDARRDFINLAFVSLQTPDPGPRAGLRRLETPNPAQDVNTFHPSQLPDELLPYIFRNSSVSRSDLCNCALIARRYLEVVQTCLYEEVEVSVVLIGDTEEEVEFLNESSELLRTIKATESSRYAKYIRKICFNMRSNAVGFKREGIQTTVPLLLATFLNLAPNIRSIAFGTEWDLNLESLQALSYVTNLQEFSARCFMESQICEMTRSFPRLRRLQIDDFDRLELHHVADEATFTELQCLDLGQNFSFIRPAFIDQNDDTIRDLRIGYEGAAQIDFTLFRQLRTLHLYDHYVSSAHQPVPLYDARDRSHNFWKSIDEIPALETLSFDGPRLAGVFEEAFFGAAVGFVVHKKPRLVKTLRTLRFGPWFPLDRLYSLVRWPTSKGVRRIVVPASMKSPEASQQERDKFRSVTELCDALDMEVFLADTI